MAHRTVIIVTHHVDLIVDHCAWVALLDGGSIAAQGTPNDLRKRGLLSALIERAKQSEEVAPASAATDEGDAAESSGDGTSSAPDTLVKKEEKAECVPLTALSLLTMPYTESGRFAQGKRKDTRVSHLLQGVFVFHGALCRATHHASICGRSLSEILDTMYVLTPLHNLYAAG